MELLLLAVKLIGGSVLGLAYQLVKKNQSMDTKARLANLEYPGFWGFVKKDMKSIRGTFGAIILLALILGSAINPDNMGIVGSVRVFWGFADVPKRIIYEAVLVLLFITVGYSGMDFALRILSRTNNELNSAIDYKTTRLDEINHTTDKPTPTK